MELHTSSIIFHLLLITTYHITLASDPAACRTSCGSLQIKYPFGTGYGCGSPRFTPFVTCTPDSTQLILTTHTGSYPISSISYSTSTITITPPSVSTCFSMQFSPNLGLDWAGPFTLGPSIFLLLSCPPPTSSLTMKGSPVCDPYNSHLCDQIYTCPAVVELGLPLLPPANTCCVYSPANFNNKGELDIRALKCGGYSSVVSLGDYPTDPARWEYGVALKYSDSLLDGNIVESKCNSCEMSDGVCGYNPPGNSFVCVCKNGFNTTMDCHGNNLGQEVFWSPGSSPLRKMWLEILASLIFCMAI